MRRHQQDVESLLNNALLLDFEGAQRAATNVIDEPRLARPGPNDQDALNTRLPEHFFVLQDELVERASEVQVAGQAHDSQRLARASGDLTRTCIACHAAYLQGPNP